MHLQVISSDEVTGGPKKESYPAPMKWRETEREHAKFAGLLATQPAVPWLALTSYIAVVNCSLLVSV